MEENKTFDTKTTDTKTTKKEQFKIVVPPEIEAMRAGEDNKDKILMLNELIVHRILDGAKLSTHKHLKTWPGVLIDGEEKTKLTVIYNTEEMDGNQAEDYIYNRDFSSDKVIIVKRDSVASFK